MADDQTQPSIVEECRSESASEVLGAHSDIGGTPAFVIADLSRDDAWVAAAAEVPLDVAEWC